MANEYIDVVTGANLAELRGAQDKAAPASFAAFECGL
jgi:hypothetical protein